MKKESDDNRSNQLNPNNDAYWQSRGFDERPNDWHTHVVQGNQKAGIARKPTKS